MNKKEIYEYLAKIYLDASTKKKNKKTQKNPEIFKNLFFISIIIIFVLIILLFNVSRKNGLLFTDLEEALPIKSKLVFVLQPNIVKINFNFDPAKEEYYHINLNNLDLERFNELTFLVRKAHYENDIILKVKFANAVNEKSDISVYNIPSHRWQECKVKLSDFKDINDWSKMSSLSFIIEEWNVRKKEGIIYIDNVRFLR